MTNTDHRIYLDPTDPRARFTSEGIDYRAESVDRDSRGKVCVTMIRQTKRGADRKDRLGVWDNVEALLYRSPELAELVAWLTAELEAAEAPAVTVAGPYVPSTGYSLTYSEDGAVVLIRNGELLAQSGDYGWLRGWAFAHGHGDAFPQAVANDTAEPTPAPFQLVDGAVQEVLF